MSWNTREPTFPCRGSSLKGPKVTNPKITFSQPFKEKCISKVTLMTYYHYLTDTFLFKVAENVVFELGSERVRHAYAVLISSRVVTLCLTGFKISFPCRPKASGEVMLSIDISFSTKSGRLLWGPLYFSLKRSCSSGEHPLVLLISTKKYLKSLSPGSRGFKSLQYA